MADKLLSSLVYQLSDERIDIRTNSQNALGNLEISDERIVELIKPFMYDSVVS